MATSLIIDGLPEGDEPNTVVVKYTKPVDNSAAWETATFTVIDEYVDDASQSVRKTQLDLPGVYRMSEASNKAIAKLLRSNNRLRIQFTTVDMGVILQPGDMVTVTDTTRNVDIDCWVESNVMVDYGRYRITAVVYSDRHFPTECYTEDDDVGSWLDAPVVAYIDCIEYQCDILEGTIAAAYDVTDGYYWPCDEGVQTRGSPSPTRYIPEYNDLKDMSANASTVTSSVTSIDRCLTANAITWGTGGSSSITADVPGKWDTPSAGVHMVFGGAYKINISQDTNQTLIYVKTSGGAGYLLFDFYVYATSTQVNTYIPSVAPALGGGNITVAHTITDSPLSSFYTDPIYIYGALDISFVAQSAGQNGQPSAHSKSVITTYLKGANADGILFDLTSTDDYRIHPVIASLQDPVVDRYNVANDVIFGAAASNFTASDLFIGSVGSLPLETTLDSFITAARRNNINYVDPNCA